MKWEKIGFYALFIFLFTNYVIEEPYVSAFISVSFVTILVVGGSFDPERPGVLGQFYIQEHHLTPNMDNVLASRLGVACERAAASPAVDSIDRGLALQRELENADFLVS